MDLTTFLAARLDEDEAAAIAWVTVFSNPTAAQREHIARNDPARVLREVAAKRAILAAHKHRFEGHGDAFGCDTCHWDRDYGMPLGVEWCTTLRALAAVHSDHPDYDPSWDLHSATTGG